MQNKIPEYNQETEYVTEDGKGELVVKAMPKAKGMQMQAINELEEHSVQIDEPQAVRGTEIRWTERVNKILAENKELKVRIEQLEGEKQQ